MKEHGELINVTSSAKICRDPKDNFFYPSQKMGKHHILLQEIKTYLILKDLDERKSPH
jgi:predicted nucleic acid-binding protein